MKKNIIFPAIALLIVFVFSGCVSIGRENLNKAQKALEEGQPLNSLVFATEAILEDPDYDRAKNFLRDNAETELAKIEQFLDTTSKSKNPEDVEKRYDAYVNLQEFYTNLEKIGLPIVKGKKLFGLIKGWEWSIPIKDYSTQIAEEKEKARKVFLEAGYASIDSGELARADDLLDKVVYKFNEANSEQQKKDKKAISDKFTEWAAALHGVQAPEQLLKGLEAYDLALNYNKDNQKAKSGKEKMSLELSDVYLALGLKQEKKDTIKSLEAAMDYFKKALKYNKDNTDAAEGIKRSEHRMAVLYTEEGMNLAASSKVEAMKRAHELFEKALVWDPEYQKAAEQKEMVTEKIAEYYYREGNRYAKNLSNEDSLNAAVNAYDNAQEWIADYKDSEQLKRRVYVSSQVIDLKDKIAVTTDEYQRTNKRIVTLSDLVNQGHKGINDLFYVSDKIIQLNDQMKTISTVMSPLSSVPFVGPLFTTTGTMLDRSRRPVNSTSNKVKKVQKPYITPSRDMINNVKARTDSIRGTMGEIKTSLEYTRDRVNKLNGCVKNIKDPNTLRKVERDAKNIGKKIDKINSGLKDVNAVQDEVEGTMKELADSISVINKVTGGVRTIMGPLDKIDSVTSEIKKVLDEEVCVDLLLTKECVRVGDAVAKAGGPIKILAKEVLNPLLDELKIELPTVPGLDGLDSTLNDVEGYYKDIKEAEAQLNEAADKIVGVPEELRGEVDKMTARTGCTF